jgi:hypothetical protein
MINQNALATLGTAAVAILMETILPTLDVPQWIARMVHFLTTSRVVAAVMDMLVEGIGLINQLRTLNVLQWIAQTVRWATTCQPVLATWVLPEVVHSTLIRESIQVAAKLRATTVTLQMTRAVAHVLLATVAEVIGSPTLILSQLARLFFANLELLQTINQSVLVEPANLVVVRGTNRLAGRGSTHWLQKITLVALLLSANVVPSLQTLFALAILVMLAVVTSFPATDRTQCVKTFLVWTESLSTLMASKFANVLLDTQVAERWTRQRTHLHSAWQLIARTEIYLTTAPLALAILDLQAVVILRQTQILSQNARKPIVQTGPLLTTKALALVTLGTVVVEIGTLQRQIIQSALQWNVQMEQWQMIKVLVLVMRVSTVVGNSTMEPIYTRIALKRPVAIGLRNAEMIKNVALRLMGAVV